MSLRTVGARAMVLGLAAPVLVALSASSAWAEASTYCVKATKVAKHYTGKWNDRNCTAANGTHEGKYEKLASHSRNPKNSN